MILSIAFWCGIGACVVVAITALYRRITWKPPIELFERPSDAVRTQNEETGKDQIPVIVESSSAATTKVLDDSEPVQVARREDDGPQPPTSENLVSVASGPIGLEQTYTAPPAVIQERRQPALGQRGPHRGKKEPIATDRQNRSSRPKVRLSTVCWSQEQHWQLGVELDDEMSNFDQLTLFQNGLALENDARCSNRWTLVDIDQPISVFVGINAPEAPAEMPVSETPYILLRLLGPRRDHGKSVRYASRGSYLVVAPEAWDRNNERSGPPPIADESVAIADMRAHFFEIEDPTHDVISFLTSEGVVDIPMKKPLFRFEGATQLSEASAALGPLFVGDIPELWSNSPAWQTIRSIVVGSEGPGPDHWREVQPLDNETTNHHLPSRIKEEGSGWYFVRFYDARDELVESADFRFIKTLSNIDIDAVSALPGSDDHAPVKVTICHEPGTLVSPCDGDEWTFEIERSETQTAIVIPPKPALDLTHWSILAPGGRPVEVAVLAGRIWWSCADGATEPTTWNAALTEVRREDFLPGSTCALWIRLPAPRWTRQVALGFRPETLVSIPVPINSRTLRVHLREFGGTRELRSGEPAELLLQVSSCGNPVLAPILAIKGLVQCDRCNYSAASARTLLEHYRQVHLGELHRELNYEEHRRRNVSLPQSIYKCCICEGAGSETYVATNRVGRSATSDILEHIDDVHPGCIHRFRVVSSVEEIRSCVIRDLPSIFQCVLCNSEGEGIAWVHAHLPGCIERHIKELCG